MNMKTKLICIVLFCLSLSGCGYELKNAPQAEQNANNSNVTSNSNRSNQNNSPENSNLTKPADNTNSTTPGQKSDGSKIVIDGTSESNTFPCADGEVEITKDATANVITLTGECKMLTVDGVSNTINVEKVGEIVLKGVSNKVTYGAGLDGKKPRIKNSGVSTTVESVEEKKKSEEKQ
jgi:hypothetical protein